MATPNAAATKLLFLTNSICDWIPPYIAAFEEAMAAPGFYKRASEEIAADTADFEALGRELDEAYTRWEELEALRE